MGKYTDLVGKLYGAPQEATPAAPPEPAPSVGMEVLRGNAQGVMNLGAVVGGVTKFVGDVTGSETVSVLGADAVDYWNRRASDFSAAVPSYKDVDLTAPGGVRRAALYAAHGVGTLIPMATASMVAGVGGASLGARALAGRVAAGTAETVGGTAGLAANSYGMELGSIYADQAGQGIAEPGRAALYAAPAAALDVIPEARVLRKALSPSTTGNFLRRGVTEFAKQGALEGGTEVAQTIIEQKGARRDLDLEEVINAGILGALGGGTVGGAVSMLPQRQEAATPEDTPEPVRNIQEALVEKITNPEADLGEVLREIAAGPNVRMLLEDFEPSAPPTFSARDIAAGTGVQGAIEDFYSRPEQAIPQMLAMQPGFNPEAPFAEERDQRVANQLQMEAERAAAFDSANPEIPQLPGPAASAPDRQAIYEGVKAHLESNQFFARGTKNGKPVTGSDFTAALQQSYPSLVGTPKGNILAALNAAVKGRKLTEKQQEIINNLDFDLARHEEMARADEIAAEAEAAKQAGLQQAREWDTAVRGYPAEWDSVQTPVVPEAPAQPVAYEDLSPEEQALADRADAQAKFFIKAPEAPTYSQWDDAASHQEPAVPEGMVRVYRGGGMDSDVATDSATKGRWFTTSREVAEYFLQNEYDGKPSRLSYVDLTPEQAEAYASDPAVGEFEGSEEGALILPPEVANASKVLFNYTPEQDDFAALLAEAKRKQGGMSFSTAPAAPEPLTKATVQAAFPGQTVYEAGDAFVVALNNGSFIRVSPTREIAFGEADRIAAERELGRKLSDNEAPVASWVAMPRGGEILLTEQGVGELPHEVFHAAMQLALTKGQRAAVLKKYGNEEAAARAYKEFRDGQAPDAPTFFQKILEFFRGIREKLFPTADGAFKEIASGEVWANGTEAERGALLKKFMTAWHGTPHDFDKFSTEKIGTGEGAQAYGYGLYFAGAKEVAEYYKKALSPTQRMLKIGDIEFIVDDLYTQNTPEGRVVKAIFDSLDQGYTPQFALDAARRLFAKDPEAMAVIRDATSAKIKTTKKGRLYEVELAPQEDEYLLWDKPLSEQSEKVKEAITAASSRLPKSVRDDVLESLNSKDEGNGNWFYEQVSYGLTGKNKKTADEKAASEYLHSLGIRGIKYLDGSSRGKGEGNYNYVIFNDADVSIKAKYSFGEQLDAAGKALTKLDAGRKLDRFVAFFMPVNRMLDNFRDRAQLQVIRPSINKLAEVWQKQRTTQDELLSVAGLHVNRALDAMAKEKGLGTDPVKRNQFNAIMEKSTLWQLFPGGEVKDNPVWTDSLWASSGMQERTGLSLSAAQAKLNSEWRALSPDMQAAYTAMLKLNEATYQQQKKENIAFIKRTISDPVLQTKLLQQVEKRFSKVRGPYFPLSRFGEFNVRIKEADVYNEAGELERRGKTLFSASFENQAEFEEFAAQAKADPLAILRQHYDNADQLGEVEVDPNYKAPASRMTANIPQSFMEKLKSLIATTGMVDLRKELRGIRREIAKEVKAGSMAIPDAVVEKLTELSKAQTITEAVRLQGELSQLLSNNAEEQAVLREVMAAIDGAGLDADTANRMKNDFDQLWLAALPESSVMKHFVKRKGVAGYNEDMMRSFLSYHQKHARAMAFIKYGSQIGRTLTEMERTAQSVEDAGTRAEVQQFAQMMREHQSHMMTEKVNPLVNQLTKVPFLWYLTSPSIFLVQSSQPYTVTLPFLAARSGFSKAFAAVTRAYGRQAQQEFTDQKLLAFNEAHGGLIEKLRDLDDAGDTAEINRLTAKLSMKDKEMLALAMTPTLSISLSHEAIEFIKSGSPKENRWLDKAGLFMSISETASRKAGFLAAFDVKMQQTGDFASALKLATDAVNDTLFDYSAANRPKVLTGNFGRIFGQFRVFQIQLAFKTLKMVTDSTWFSNLPEAERKVARKELLTFFGMNFALAGAVGLPGMKMVGTIMTVLHGLLGDDDEPYNFELEMSKALPAGVLKGIPALFGMDLSKRIGAGSLTEIFKGEPPEGKSGLDLAGWYAANAAGPVFSTLVTAPLQAAEKFDKGEWMEAFKAVAPKPVKDLVRAYELSTEGMKTGSGLTQMTPEEIDLHEIVLAAVGINPTDLALKAEETRMVTSYSTQISERRAKLVNAFTKAATAGDFDEMQSAAEKVAEFNRKMPMFGLKGSDLSEGIKRQFKKDRGDRGGLQQRVEMVYGEG